RFARLIPRSGTFGNTNTVGVIKLGEFKVVATPGFVPDNLTRRNLGEFENGGHLVWAEPWIPGSGFEKRLSARDENAPASNSTVGDAATVTLGFHHSRAARLASVSFAKKTDVPPGEHISRVEISASTTTSLGPFEPLGEWPLDQTDSEVTFDHPIWARYLRFGFYGADDARRLTLPDQISVWEVPTSDSYRSVLAEWGHYVSSGPLEAANEPRCLGPTERGANDRRETALPLPDGQAAPGVALLDDYDAWYRLEVPAALTTISLARRGAPTLMA